jgi:hypothetical protein
VILRRRYFCCAGGYVQEDAHVSARIERMRKFWVDFGNCQLYTDLYRDPKGFRGQGLRRTWRYPKV